MKQQILSTHEPGHTMYYFKDNLSLIQSHAMCDIRTSAIAIAPLGVMMLSFKFNIRKLGLCLIHSASAFIPSYCIPFCITSICSSVPSSCAGGVLVLYRIYVHTYIYILYLFIYHLLFQNISANK